MVEELRLELVGIIAEQEANPPDDEHDVEGSSVGYERARVTALLADAEARVAELDEALGRVAAGSYGGCEVCGADIDDERLAALPTTRRCIGCALATSPPGPQRMRRSPG
jgi:DnaK suppressor protein